MPITIIPDTGVNTFYVNADTGRNIILSGIGTTGANLFLSGIDTPTPHNQLQGLQGGQASQYYHLNASEYANLNTGIDSSLFYLASNPSGFITGVDLSAYVTGDVVRPADTGQFYPASNPSGFITGVDLSAYVTGDVIRPSDTGQFYAASNPSGYITGQDLSSYYPRTNPSGFAQTGASNYFISPQYISGNQIATVVDPVRTTFTGNGVLSGFAISGADNLVNPSALIFAIDGVLQEPIVDYSVNSGILTTTSPLPSGSKGVVISPTNSLQVSQMIPADGSVTSTKLASNIAIAGQLTAPNQLINTSDDVLTVESILDEDLIFVHDDFWGGGNITIGVITPQSQMGWIAILINGSSTLRYARHIIDAIPAAGTVGILTGANLRDGAAFATSVNHGGGGSYTQSEFNNTTTFKVRFKLPSTAISLRVGLGSYPAANTTNPTRFIGMDATPPSTAWSAGAAITLNDYRRPTVANGRRYYASVGGTTGGSEPTWPTSAAGTVVDGTVTWTEDGRDGYTNFQFLTRDSTDKLTGTRTDSGITVDTGWHTFTLKYKGSNNWGMFVDSGTEYTLTLGTATLHFIHQAMTNSAGAKSVLFDYFRFLQIGRQ